MSDACEHDLSERETACADGLCPICLVSRVGLLEGRERVAVAERDALAERADALHRALRKVLDTREAEAKAKRATDDALANFTYRGPEMRAWKHAMLAASEAEKEARDVLAAPSAPKEG